jgi:isopropylmalate/homocitrate/citramalate synthase
METNSPYEDARRLHPHLPARVEVIDCTLRDGEQSAGVSFNVAEKIELGCALAKAGVTVLDAGFPAASMADKEAMQAIVACNLGVTVAGTARPLPGDIAAVEEANATEIFIFMPTSDLRLSQVFGKSRVDAERLLLNGAEDAAGRGLGVNLVFEDATRADFAWLASLVGQVSARVPVVRVVAADTVGSAHPGSIAKMFGQLRGGIDASIVLCAHCHNDFGLAAANTLATVTAGATAITCTINGIGERAGNADLAEVVAALTHLFGTWHGVDPMELVNLSAMVERMSGVHMSAQKAVTGFNVFRHESGVHVDAMIKDSRSYEFLPSDWLGRRPEYVLGKHSGIGVVREMLAVAGISLSDSQQRALLATAKQIADTRDKTPQRDAFEQKMELQARLLAGLDILDLLAAVCPSDAIVGNAEASRAAAIHHPQQTRELLVSQLHASQVTP